MHLAGTRLYTNLDVPLECALDIHDKSTRQLATCTVDEKLFKIMDRLVTRDMHRLIIVDDKYHIVGILSVSDLMKFIVTSLPITAIHRRSCHTSDSSDSVCGSFDGAMGTMGPILY